jgi:hypothetical protein
MRIEECLNYGFKNVGFRFQVSEKAEKKIKVFRNLGIEELTERTEAILDSPIIVSLIPKFLNSQSLNYLPDT